MTATERDELMEYLRQQFGRMDGRLDRMDGQFTEVARRFDEMDGRLSGLDLALAELRHEMLGHFDDIYRRLERLEQEYHAITQALRRIEAVLADEHGRREILERDLAALKRDMAAIQARIAQIEQHLAR